MANHQKHALVVVSNIQEFKILFLNTPLIKKFPEYSFTVATTKKPNEIHLPSKINLEYISIESVQKSKLTRPLWALKNQFFFYRNRKKSHSASQKFVINIFNVIALRF